MLSNIAALGDIFAVGGARLERIVMRLRQKPRIELGRTRLRRGGGPFGRLILCARFRRINRRRMVIRLLRRGACLSRFGDLLLGRRGFENADKSSQAISGAMKSDQVKKLEPNACP